MKLKRNTLTNNMILIKLKFISTALFILSSCTVFSQSAYPLHPSIGDTLESIEKLDYSIFSFIPNSGFEYGSITFEENEFFFNAVFKDSLVKYALNKEVIIEAQQNIEKINAYYRLKAKSDEEEEETANYNADRPSGKKPALYNKAMNDQIKKEARMQLRIQEDQQRLQSLPGTRRNDLIFQFK